MSDFDKTNTGVLFKNDTAGKSDKFPGYGGSINVDGVEYWVSAWVKDGKKGKFFSLAIKPKEEREERAAPKSTGGRVAKDEFEDDLSIPF